MASPHYSSISSARPSPQAPETPTVVNSQDSYQIPAPATATSTAETTPPDRGILPLVDRVPDVETIVKFLRESHRVKSLLSNPGLFKSEDDMKTFSVSYFAHSQNECIPDDGSEEWFWEDAREYMFESLCDNIPSSRSQLKKCREAYFRDGVYLVQSHFGTRLMKEYTFESTERQNQLKNLSGSIGDVFLEVFEQLTAPPTGKKILLINKQLDNCIETITTTSLRDLFEEGVDKHVYYISGFLCRAGEKEAERRSINKDSPGYDIGECIKEVSTHFVAQTSPSEVDEIKKSLHDGLTDLVDKWSAYGGLKYPNRQLYSLIAKIEYCYSNLATAENLRTFGGIVVSYICNEMAANDSLVCHFSSLLREGQFSDETICAAFKYYIQVFGNLRVKDLSRKLNAQLNNSTTAALRPSLATKGDTKRSKSKTKSKVTPRPKDAEVVAEESEESLHHSLLDIAENELDYNIDNDTN